jgi:uncharacterized protein YyaL (SSP411 family)
MRTGIGTFAASYDADSEGEEGRYYVWNYDAVAKTLPADTLGLFCEVYDVSRQGNWEGRSILNRLKAQDLLSSEAERSLAASRRLLLEERRQRVPPGFDDKSLADWNGLAIAAIAEAGLQLDNSAWIEAAGEAFQSLLRHQWQSETLYHSYRNGELRGSATAEGYANLVAAALNLYTATIDRAYLKAATDLASAALKHLWDDANGGFFFSPRQDPELIVRLRYAHDDATPNANATMLVNFVRLYHLTGEEDYRRRADAVLAAFGSAVGSNPFAHASFLSAIDYYFDPLQAVIIGDARAPQVRDLRRAVLALPAIQPIIQYHVSGAQLPPHHPAHGKAQKDGKPTLYLCRGTRCALPVISAVEAAAAFHSLA